MTARKSTPLRPRKAAPSASGTPTDTQAKLTDLPLIVGIGASAGGLQAFRTLFAAMPPDSGMAFVLVQHLAPDHDSMLVELLGRATPLPVVEISDGMPVAANRIFIIPPNATLTIEHGRLRVAKPAPPRELRRPIDTFFSSLAADQGENAVSIVLSGTGSDGALGLSAIKENGGFTLAQSGIDHVALAGMPHSAAATGFVDEVLTVEEMPARLMSHRQHLRQVAPLKDADGIRADAKEHMAIIADLLRGKVGHDFIQYKDKTITRRIQRRMQVLQIDTLPAFIARLIEEPQQLDLLFHEFLISVTQFFRDPQAFDALRSRALDKILANKQPDRPLRVWVAGCATGEEVYSIAIAIKEAMEAAGVTSKVQIFGTDIDDAAIAFARAGRYATTLGLSAERLERWFVKHNDEFCPTRAIREMCVFSPHSVIKDAPFSKLDLVSCRNLLIYMDNALQDRILEVFHYALKPGGFLFLGPSEGVTRRDKFFATIDKKHRLFRRSETKVKLPAVYLNAPSFIMASPAEGAAIATGEDRLARKARFAIEKYSPAYLIVSAEGDILQFSGGEVGRYLEPVAGPASLHLFDLLNKALRRATRAAFRAAVETSSPAVHDGITIRIEGAMRSVAVIVEPIRDAAEPGLYVVAFRDAEPEGRLAGDLAPGEADTSSLKKLRQELVAAKSQLQAAVEELETTNHEMKSAAEEYQSVNEELQSSNEELETSKEEMQSINEELQTVNAEMAAKNESLSGLNNDIKNLLDSTEIATLFLDADLCIKNFTPPLSEIFRVRDSDRGRPIGDIVTLLSDFDIKRDAEEAMTKLSVIERETRLESEDRTFVLHIRPYRTRDNVVDGVVLTFVDISERKRAEERTSLLMRELDHRVKNILAIVSSVISQTLRTSESPAAFAARMEGRITAIARAHSSLTHEGGRSLASLKELIERELAPYDHSGKNLEIAGPDATLTPKASLSLALAIHELASNASKYGALSTPNGRLSVTWRCEGDDEHPRLVLIWSESEGPPVTPPTRKGFGTTLIERALSYDLDGIVDRQFDPAGLRCTIDIPLNAQTGQISRPDKTAGAP